MPCCAAERKNHSVDISVQFMGVSGLWYGSRETRVASRRGQEKGTIVTAYVLCELFNNWEGRGYDDSVPGEVTKTPSSGDRTT